MNWQANFTFSSLWKPFETLTNTIKEHGDKQINAIINQKRQLNLVINKDEKIILKQKELFNKIAEERFGKILELNEKR